MTSRPDGINDADDVVLRRVAERVVELHMEVPAILTIEGGLPMSVVAGQTLHFFQPVVQAMFRLPDYQRFASLIERREALTYMVSLIEEQADVAQRRKREEKQAKKDARASRS
jgi:hypothetical protein